MKIKEKSYDNRENNMDDFLKKKKLLQEQFIKNTTKSSQKILQVENEISSDNLQIETYKQELINIKKENLKLKKENKFKDKKVEDKNREVYKYKIKMANLNEKIKSLESENKSILETNSELLTKNEKIRDEQSYYNNKILELNNLVKTLGESNLLEENNNLKTSLQELKLKNNTYIETIDSFRVGIERKNNIIKKLNDSDNKEIIKTLREKIKNQKHVIVTLEERLKTLQSQSLKDSLVKRFIVFFDKLKDSFKKSVKKDNVDDIKPTNKIDIDTKEPVIKEYQYGILEKYANRYIFKNVNGKEYLILKNNDSIVKSMKKNLGNPCMASITTKDEAIIERIYNKQNKYIDEMVGDRLVKGKSVMNKIRDDEEKEQFVISTEKEYKILIIGSLYKNKYVKALSDVGIENIVWFDSYENGIPRLKELLKSSDIVLCCTSHSRHGTSELLKTLKLEDKNNPFKYNIVKDDNVDNIISRVRFVISSLDSNYNY